MKNISFLQLVLGVGGGLLIYSGIKDLDIVSFFHKMLTDPAELFTQGGFDYSGPGSKGLQDAQKLEQQAMPSNNLQTNKPPSGGQSI